MSGYTVDAFMIVRNEEELLPHALRALEALGDSLAQVVFIDNGSTDATLEILHDWQVGIPQVVVRDMADSHHGRLRTRALSLCTAPWVLYLDADETWTADLAEWLASDEKERHVIWDFMKYSTIGDREHYDNSGNGPSTRLFRNFPGATFPQNIHTHPEHPGLWDKAMATERDLWGGPLMFDHSGCASPEKLWDKGWRYQWAAGTVGIGPAYEYVYRIDTSLHSDNLRRFPQHVIDRIFTGPAPIEGWRNSPQSEAVYNYQVTYDARYPKVQKV